MIGRTRILHSSKFISRNVIARSHNPAVVFSRCLSASTGDNGGKSGNNWDWGSWFGSSSKDPARAPDSSASVFDEPLRSSSATTPVGDHDVFTSTTQVIEEPIRDILVNSAAVSSSATGEAAVKVATEASSSFYPPQVFMNVLDNIHVNLDIPYYQAILVFSVALRLFMFPLSVQGMQHSAKMQYVKPEMDKINARMLQDENRVENKPMYDKEVKDLFAKHNVNPVKPLVVPLLQIPVFMSMFFALREMGQYYPGYAQGGVKWFVDLSVADPMTVLPVVNACLFLTMIELGGENGEMSNTAQFKLVRNAFRAMGVIMVPLMMNMPAGLFVYWIGNGTLSLMQVMLLKNPAVKNWLNILPPPPVVAAAGTTASQMPSATAMSEAFIKLAQDQAAASAKVANTPLQSSGAADTQSLNAKSDKSPFLKLYEENMRLVEANKKLLEKAAKGGKY